MGGKYTGGKVDNYVMNMKGPQVGYIVRCDAMSNWRD